MEPTAAVVSYFISTLSTDRMRTSAYLLPSHILMVLEAAVPQFVPGICARILDDGKAIGRLETGIARGLVEATG